MVPLLLERFDSASREYFRARGELVRAARARHGEAVDRWQLREERFEATVARDRRAAEVWREAASGPLEGGADPLRGPPGQRPERAGWSSRASPRWWPGLPARRGCSRHTAKLSTKR